jgi:hypothetical protein
MEFLGDMSHVDSHFGPFGDSVSVVARLVHGLCQTYYRLRNRFGRTRWNSLMMRLKCKLDSVRLKIVPILTHRVELLGDMGHVESYFGPFGHSVSVGAR